MEFGQCLDPQIVHLFLERAQIAEGVGVLGRVFALAANIADKDKDRVACVATTDRERDHACQLVEHVERILGHALDLTAKGARALVALEGLVDGQRLVGCAAKGTQAACPVA